MSDHIEHLYSELGTLVSRRGKITRIQFMQLCGPSLTYVMEHRSRPRGYAIPHDITPDKMLELMRGNFKLQQDFVEYFADCDRQLATPVMQRGRRGALPDAYEIFQNDANEIKVTAIWRPRHHNFQYAVSHMNFAFVSRSDLGQTPVVDRVDVETIAPGKLPALSLLCGEGKEVLRFHKLGSHSKIERKMELEEGEYYDLLIDPEPRGMCFDVYESGRRGYAGSAEYLDIDKKVLGCGKNVVPESLVNDMLHVGRTVAFHEGVWRDFIAAVEMRPMMRLDPVLENGIPLHNDKVIMFDKARQRLQAHRARRAHP